MADVPHERSLVKRLEGKPFVLLGINSDEDREKLKKVLTKESITWRSWWDREMTGPIATRWNVHGWPTLYLLDGKGVIRHKGDHLRAVTLKADKDGRMQTVNLLDEAVEELLKETQSK